MSASSAKEEVLAASDRFYAALASVLVGDAEPMKDLWVHDETCTLGQPVGPWRRGWKAIWDAWQKSAARVASGSVTRQEISIEVHGDVAYTATVERVCVTIADKQHDFTSQVTDIYRRVDGAWKLVHHHSDIAPGVPDIVTEEP